MRVVAKATMVCAALAAVACSGSTVSIVDGTPTPDPSSTSPTPVPPGQQSGLVTYEKNCATKPSLPGALTSSALSFTVSYPSSWNNNTTQNDQPRLANYSTVTVPKQEQQGDLFGGHHFIGDPSMDPGKYLRDLSNTTTGERRDLTIGGHPAVSWWVREAAPAPGCAGCNGDPGPDFIRIHLAISMGNREILQVTGSARVTAVAQVFCDIQAIEATVATTK